jgi:hypothetical protein
MLAAVRLSQDPAAVKGREGEGEGGYKQLEVDTWNDLDGISLLGGFMVLRRASRAQQQEVVNGTGGCVSLCPFPGSSLLVSSITWI